MLDKPRGRSDSIVADSELLPRWDIERSSAPSLMIVQFTNRAASSVDGERGVGVDDIAPVS